MTASTASLGGSVRSVKTIGAPTITHRARLLVTVLAGWSLFVWATRLNHTWTSATEGLVAKLSSTVFALALIVAAVAAVSEVWRRDGHRAVLFARVLCGGTILVWLVRAPMILLGGWDIGFVVVHMVLAAASVALAVVTWKAVGRPASTAGGAGIPTAA